MVQPGWAVTAIGWDQVTRLPHVRAVPTFQDTERAAAAGRRRTVTLTGQGDPGAQLPVRCSTSPVTAPPWRAAIVSTPWRRCARDGVECSFAEPEEPAAGGVAWSEPRPSAPAMPLPWLRRRT